MAKNRKSQQNRIRIIGGKHGGRKLDFPDVDGLRPTIDRVRETVFNWLQPSLPSARCIDLFAGSGALGIEAISRGASKVHFVDNSASVIRQIEANVKLLGAEAHAQMYQQNAQNFLKAEPEQPYHIAFLDPPFADGLLTDTLALLVEKSFLTNDALVYLEQDSHQPWSPLPENWVVKKEGKAGQAAYRLIHRAR